MSQTNFFSFPDDESGLIESILSANDTGILNGIWFPIRNPIPAESQSSISSTELLIYPMELIGEVDLIVKGGDGFYGPDYFRQPYVELELSRLTASGLLPGRIYGHIGHLATKTDNDVYRRWYDRIDRKIRKNTEVVSKPFRAFKSAKKWFDSGGTFLLGDIHAKSISGTP